MSNTKIRPAAKADVGAIDDLISEWTKPQWPAFQPENRVKTLVEALSDEKSHLILVYEDSAEILGVLHLIFYWDILLGARNCHLNFLLVKKGYRDKGIGSELLNEAARKARKRGAIEMHVDTKFEDAVRFYRKIGFIDDGVWLELSLKKKTESAS
jgi:GNAT superfamily N-acetyltransferase